MILVIQYILPLVFIGVGVWIRRSKDEALIKSKSLGTVLIVLGILTLISRVLLDNFIN